MHELDGHLVVGIGVAQVDQAQDGEADVHPVGLFGGGAGQEGQTGARYEELPPAYLGKVAQQELGIHDEEAMWPWACPPTGLNRYRGDSSNGPDDVRRPDKVWGSERTAR